MSDSITTSWTVTATIYEISNNSSITPEPQSCPPRTFTEIQLQSLTIERWFLGMEFFLAIVS